MRTAQFQPNSQGMSWENEMALRAVPSSKTTHIPSYGGSGADWSWALFPAQWGPAPDPGDGGCICNGNRLFETVSKIPKDGV